MKKLIVPVLIIIILTFCACNKGSVEPEVTEAPETTLSPTVKVTVPEGYTAVQTAKLLEESGVCSASDFMFEVNDIEKLRGVYKFIEYIDTSKKAFYLEGYIFPDTYEFYRGESASSVLARFLKNTESKLTDEYYLKAESLGYSMDEIITLASIVQSESGFANENAKVSSVLHNRIKSPDYGKLQCDVTINYVNDYITDSPYLDGETQQFKEYYNTYKCAGVPAGAICNPGIACIDAALNPADTNYFFFVTDADMNYYYAATYEEHLKNCKACGL